MNIVSNSFKQQYDYVALALESARRFVEEFPYDLDLGYFIPANSANGQMSSIHVKNMTPDLMNELGFVLAEKGKTWESKHETWINFWRIDNYTHPDYPALRFCIHTDWIERIQPE